MAVPGDRIDRRIVGVFWLFFMVIMARNAWLCEDAFITYRVVDNFAHGYGFRWNTLERVQVYTHPLWMLAMSAAYLANRDAYLSAMTLSFACSGAVVWLLLSRACRTLNHALVMIVVLTFSKAFVDFSTGGLENPLAHLLLALLCLEYLKPSAQRSLAKMVRWAGLLLIARMDLVWLWAPAVVHVAWENRAWRRERWRAWLGLWPFFAWGAFSLLYYGFFFPNSAYAKLGVDVPAKALLTQGVYYLLNSISWDPLTLFAMASLVTVGLERFRSDRERAALSVGVVLYIFYVVRIGGDYMTGRFLTAPLVVSLFGLSGVELESPWQLAIATTVALVLGFSAPRPPIFTRDEYAGLGGSPSKVDDEHGFRHLDTSLLRLNRENKLAEFGGWVGDGVNARLTHARVVVYRNIGYFGFFAGPDVHIIDPYGIGDPFMARMHFDESTAPWLAAHFMRRVPDGYPEAAIGEGVIKDPRLQKYFEKLELVTRGPVFDLRRLALVVRFNLGLEPAPVWVPGGAAATVSP